MNRSTNSPSPLPLSPRRGEPAQQPLWGGSWSRCRAKRPWGLSMNFAGHAPHFPLSPSEGERVGERGPFARSGSWSQCMRQRERGLSMNWETSNVGHPITRSPHLPSGASGHYPHRLRSISLSPLAGSGPGRGARTLEGQWAALVSKHRPPLPTPLLQRRRGSHIKGVLAVAGYAPQPPASSARLDVGCWMLDVGCFPSAHAACSATMRSHLFCAFRINSTTSRTAPCPPQARVT